MKRQKLAVPFDKGWGFCVMKETAYSKKRKEIHNASQFEARNGENDDLTVKTEKQINSSLHQIKKRQK